MTAQARINAIIATAHNLHFGGTGSAMTPSIAATLCLGDKLALCRALEANGGSDLYTQEDAREAFVQLVSA